MGQTCNPFDRYTVRVEVGDYVPNLLAAETERLEGIRQEFRAANGRMESIIESVEGGLSELTQTVGGFDLRIQNAEQAAAEGRFRSFPKRSTAFRPASATQKETLPRLYRLRTKSTGW